MKKKVKVTMVNDKDGYAQCDQDDVAEVLELLTGKKLEPGIKYPGDDKITLTDKEADEMQKPIDWDKYRLEGPMEGLIRQVYENTDRRGGCDDVEK